jgi:hypothetical protein
VVESEAKTNFRLGSIERFLLVYAMRQKRRKRDYVSRTSAMRLFHIERRGSPWSGQLPLRPAMPSAEYNSLQVRFTHAIQRLEKKRLVDILRADPPMVVDEQGETIAASVVDPLGYALGIRPTWGRRTNSSWAAVYGRNGRNRVAYRLTDKGRQVTSGLVTAKS